MNIKFAGTYLLASVAMMIAVLLLIFPQQGFDAALRGVVIWWDVLFPALFPFFVISEMLLGFGIVHFLGTLLDPMMRPVFRLPGIGGFVMAMGFASGYPVGARLTSQLWDQKLVNREEAERLVASTTSSDPIFLIGAVAVGFFHDVSLALILAAAHYGGAIIIGLLMRFHGASSKSTEQPVQSKGFIGKRAFQAMHKARLADGRPIGILLSQSIKHSISLIFVVGGLVVFFSVVLEILTTGGIMSFLYHIVQWLLQLFGLPPALTDAVMKGVFEVTLGAKAAGSAAGDISLVSKVAIAAFVLSWAGLSVHAQVVSLLSHTNLRYLPFVTARFVHGIFSAALVFLIWQPMQPLRGEMSVFLPDYDVNAPLSSFVQMVIPTSLFVFAGTFVVISLLFAAYSLLKLMYEKVGGTR
uniref:sporulation integral membrane protein YlbJ n=1 Tax=Paenibacillus eucommiae TaxID=1355755 RepID=UPI0035E3FDF3